MDSSNSLALQSIDPALALSMSQPFGDWKPQVNKILTFCDRSAEILAASVPEAAEFASAFASANTARKVQVAMHPATRDALGGGIARFKTNREVETEELRATLKSAGAALASVVESREVISFGSKRSLGVPPGDILVWEDSWNEHAVGKHFGRLFDEEIATSVSSQLTTLVAPSDEQFRVLGNGYQLLQDVAPELANSVLRHVKVIGIIDYEDAGQRVGRVRTDLCQNVSTHAVPGTIFLSPSPLRTALHAAEALLHEAAHKKLSDLVLTGTIFRDRYDPETSPTVSAIWNRPLSWNENAWSADRALFAFHVYVYLVAFFGAVKDKFVDIVYAYPDSASAKPSNLIRGALARAHYLGREVRNVFWSELGPDGKALVDWLSDYLDRIGAPIVEAVPDLELLLDRYDRETREISKMIRLIPNDINDDGSWAVDASDSDWPIRRTIAHLIHSEIVAANRVLAVIGEASSPQFSFYDGDRWSTVARNDLSFLDLSIVFRSIRMFTSSNLRAAESSVSAKVYASRSVKTLVDLVADMVDHAYRHIPNLQTRIDMHSQDGGRNS